MKLKPYKFRPVLKTVIWGGEKIVTFKAMHSAQCTMHNGSEAGDNSPFSNLHTPLKEGVGESWELSGMEGMESVVDGGEDDGLTLTQLIDRHGADLLGEAVYRQTGNRFPLLIKLIDAHRDLSVQVHPDDAMAQRLHGSGGKTEMWYIVDHEPGAQIMAGFDRAITPEEYDRRVADGTIMNVVARHESHRGQVFFLPAGCIHSIGAGNMVLEVQQACDITYRVFDYNRLDKDGKPRQLHTQLAREALNFQPSRFCQPSSPPLKRRGCEELPLVACDYFVVERLEIKRQAELDLPDSFLAMTCVEGSVVMADENGCVTTMRQGETILVPACLSRLVINGTATVITARL